MQEVQSSVNSFPFLHSLRDNAWPTDEGCQWFKGRVEQDLLKLHSAITFWCIWLLWTKICHTGALMFWWLWHTLHVQTPFLLLRSLVWLPATKDFCHISCLSSSVLSGRIKNTPQKICHLDSYARNVDTWLISVSIRWRRESNTPAKLTYIKTHPSLNRFKTSRVSLVF